MPHLQTIERSATVAFCPNAGLLAAGTVAGAIDMSFSTSSVLELFSLDFASASETPPVLGTIQAPERFNRLAWSSHIADTSPQPLGILAGGLADGSVVLWDPAIVTDKNAKTEGKTPLLAKIPKHTGGVKGLEFNSFSPNLLASGAADGDLCIWDLAKPSTPSLYPALKGGAGGAVSGLEITYLAWNKKVQHILASATANGTTVVWDLKRQKPVISFKDPNSQRRASVLQWNPEVATQLVVASDDDRSPTLQMWDLRNSVSPIREFVGHTKGVLGMSWSQHDSSLLLSSAKDNRTICWDVHTADVMCELPCSNIWNFDVQWCPTVPGVFSTSSFDGHIGIYNLHACTQGKMTETVNADFTVTQSSSGESVPLKRAPAWMRRPAGASFGFGGRLVSFVNHKVQSTDGTGQIIVKDQGVISLSQVVTEHDLIARSEAFEQAIAGGEKTTLKEFCATKAQGMGNDEGETWSFLGLLFEPDGRRELLRRLGFADMVQQQQEAAAAAAAAAPGHDGQLMSPDGTSPSAARAQSMGGMSGAPEDFFEQQDDPDFFDKLPEQGIHATEVSAPAAAGNHRVRGASEDGHSVASHAEHHNNHLPDASLEHEEDIQRALVAGNYEAAVEACFKVNRLADALLIANIFNSDLYKKTMHRYMKRCPKPYMHIVKASVDQDFASLVRTRPVGQWRETLALLATYTAQEEWTALCDSLAARLNQAGMHHAASLCYICAGNVDQAVSHWTKAFSSSAPKPDAKDSGAGVGMLQTVIEKAVVFGLATGNKKASSSLSELLTSYASILAAQGRLATALDYLEYVPGEASTMVAVLKDRIFRSGTSAIPSNIHPPPFPFIREDVRPVVDAAAKQQQQQQQPAASSAQAANPYAAYAGYNGTSTTSSYAQGAAPNPYSGYGNTAQGAYGQPAAPSPMQPAQPQQHMYPASTTTQPAVTAQQGGAYGGSGYATSTPTNAGPAGNAYPASSYSNYPAPSAYPTATSSVPAAQPYGTAGYPAASYQPEPPQGQVYHVAKRTGPSAGGTSSTAPPPSFTPTTTAPANAPNAAYGSSQPAAPTAHTMGQTVPQPNYFVPTTTATASTSAAAPFAAAAGAGGVAMPSGVMPAPGIMPAPTSQRAAAPAQPAGPPANASIASVDTSKVPADQRAIITSLTSLYNSCVPLANNPAKKREMDDNTKKIGQLFWKLNAGSVSEGVVPKLLQLCAAVDASDWHSANHIQVQMTTTDWEECGFWLGAVKRLIKMRQQGGM